MPGGKKHSKFYEKLRVAWQKTLSRLAPLGGVSSGNKIKIYNCGDQAFTSILRDINNAQISIYIEVYIFAADNIGTLVRDALVRARKRGVKIFVLYDHVGSSLLSQNFFKPLLDLDTQVVQFNPIWPWHSGPLLFRNHRKIITIDNNLSYCGGMNITDDYAGPTYGTNKFKDIVAKLTGPAAKDLLEITQESLAESLFQSGANTKIINNNLSQKKIINIFKNFFTKKPNWLQTKLSRTIVQVLRSNSRKNIRHIQKSLVQVLSTAQSYSYFTTPYFLPPRGLTRALIHAKKRGVDVRILTCGLSDVPIMYFASQHIYAKFIRSGVRIYEMKNKILHAKIAVIDGFYSTLGSYNLDNWSARRNLEVTVSFLDDQISQELKSRFFQDVELCDEITEHKIGQKSWLKKIWCWLAYMICSL